MEVIRRVTFEVLTGEMQDRYAERGALQLHPNYIFDPEFATFGNPSETRIAASAAFLLRWAGVSGRAANELDRDRPVPMLLDIHAGEVTYGDLNPDDTFDILRAIECIDSDIKFINPSAPVRQTIWRFPAQPFTILPSKRGWRKLLGPGYREAVRAHNLYLTELEGPGAHIPLGKTVGSSTTHRRRRGLKVIEGGQGKSDG